MKKILILILILFLALMPIRETFTNIPSIGPCSKNGKYGVTNVDIYNTTKCMTADDFKKLEEEKKTETKTKTTKTKTKKWSLIDALNQLKKSIIGDFEFYTKCVDMTTNDGTDFNQLCSRTAWSKGLDDDYGYHNLEACSTKTLPTGIRASCSKEYRSGVNIFGTNNYITPCKAQNTNFVRVCKNQPPGLYASRVGTFDCPPYQKRAVCTLKPNTGPASFDHISTNPYASMCGPECQSLLKNN